MSTTRNAYKSSHGSIVSNNNGMKDLLRPKVIIARQIIHLPASEISKAFGVVGKIYIDAIRSELLIELGGINRPLSSWREVVFSLQNRLETGEIQF